MGLIKIVGLLFQVYFILIFIRVLSSWVPELETTKLMQFVRYYTDPYLNFFRRFVPPLGMIDISPIVAVFALWILEKVVLSLLITLIL